MDQTYYYMDQTSTHHNLNIKQQIYMAMNRTDSSNIKQLHHPTPLPGLLMLTTEQEERWEIYNILETIFDAELRLM